MELEPTRQSRGRDGVSHLRLVHVFPVGAGNPGGVHEALRAEQPATGPTRGRDRASDRHPARVMGTERRTQGRGAAR